MYAMRTPSLYVGLPYNRSYRTSPSGVNCKSEVQWSVKMAAAKSETLSRNTGSASYSAKDCDLRAMHVLLFIIYYAEAAHIKHANIMERTVIILRMLIRN